MLTHLDHQADLLIATVAVMIVAVGLDCTVMFLRACGLHPKGRVEKCPRMLFETLRNISHAIDPFQLAPR